MEKVKTWKEETRLLILDWKISELRGSQLIKADSNWRMKGKSPKMGKNSLNKKDKQQTFSIWNNHWIKTRTRLSMFIEHWKKDKAIGTKNKVKAIIDHYRSIKGKFVCWNRIWTRLSMFLEHWKNDMAINDHWTLKKDKPMKCKMQI